ncbi:hypothetical protein ACU8V7_00060 [Zobellia nedashkovskayae]
MKSLYLLIFLAPVIILAQESSSPCISNIGNSSDLGLKTWCWADNPLPNPQDPTEKTIVFAGNTIGTDNECNVNQVTNEGDELRFYLNARVPSPQSWCNNAFNMRSEISTRPWQVHHPLGTEEWFGWTYRFGEIYVADPASSWTMFQVHNGVTGLTPQISLFINNQFQYYNEGSLGEIFVYNSTLEESDRYIATGVILKKESP